ncbi:histidine protein methyltransferase 1 homolog [Arctopsyche grandis]|uniref:histidine protein methyltransferase 1 homolog n=1 Tax=Arctopsyche grandis TaxID=121162 RepID=UPI00406D820E
MMFSFKFNLPESETPCEAEDDRPEEIIPTTESSELPHNDILKAQEIFPNDKIIDNIDDLVIKANVFSWGDLQIGHVLPQDAVTYLKEDGRIQNLDNNISLADDLHSDLVEGKYEGGLKVWECTIDMSDYMCENDVAMWKDATVLDLGCGTGVLGIAAMLFGAKVHFQDYNEEVIIGSTIPNVLLNLSEDDRTSIKTKCRFFSGDWESLQTLMCEDSEKYQYDYILTSETIYNVKNYKKVYGIIKNQLKKTGFALVAAKSYYFGVGGNIRDFEKYVNDDGLMNCEICWKSEGGIPREILKLTFK